MIADLLRVWCRAWEAEGRGIGLRLKAFKGVVRAPCLGRQSGEIAVSRVWCGVVRGQGGRGPRRGEGGK